MSLAVDEPGDLELVERELRKRYEAEAEMRTLRNREAAAEGALLVGQRRSGTSDVESLTRVRERTFGIVGLGNPRQRTAGA